MTQQGLADALNVTNQSVSKWESDKCCPDISLLPEIAALFEVSLDELFGSNTSDHSNNITLELRNRIETLAKGEDYEYTLRNAYALHAIIFSKCMTAEGTKNPGWDSDDAIEHAGSAEWGISCINLPEITSIMRCGSVFFSNNKTPHITRHKLNQICSVMKVFSDTKSLAVMKAVYDLTLHDENAYTKASAIASECCLTEDDVMTHLNNHLYSYIIDKKEDNEYFYRIDGMYMHLIPLILMLCL